MVSSTVTMKYFIGSTDLTLTGTTIHGQSGPGSNDNTGVLHITKDTEIESHHQMS